MKFNQFKNKINLLKTLKLGGLNAQFKLAPELRLQYDADKIKASNPRKAAVLALFYPNENNETTFLLTERATYKGTHSAQISFPGGKKDKLDADLETTALREAFEEVGIPQKSITIIRELTDVFIPPSNFLATPFIGFTDKRPNLTTNYEVEKTIEVLVKDLLNDTSLSTVNLSTSYMENIDVPCFKLNNYIVWGATAMMLSEIKELLKC
ncbi:CoA pyrophosphatase [Polaribacter aestuariivivens]|uniref:CoA pyrophosphatase n=1 Tax=Polaribacter aestuariivivens TaxID=2304626 RepID=A0A5S3NA98_9FLAO|nr:CoA pyrophosphatase [Polaribacter aestuariivivens]TMM32123.1 CoA pyrophosphatase [Polaribacter aestuariivivens]